jgi:peptidoglycan-associated lipoprotein
MITKAIKQGLTFAVVMAFLVGCSNSDSKKKPVVAPVAAPVAEVAAPVVVAPIANVVYFEFDKYDLTPESRAVLLAHAEKLKGASVSVRLEGHADERGSREYNMALGEKRANAVRDFLDCKALKRHLWNL